MISLPYKIRKKINADRIKSESENLYFENPYNIISLDAVNENIAGSLQSDLFNLSDLSDSTEDKIEDKIMLENIYKALGKLPFDEYSAIIQYYFFCRTLEEIAVKFKMTRSGIWQIKKRAINNIRKMIL